MWNSSVNHAYKQKTHNKYPSKIGYSRHFLRFGQFGIKATSSGRLTEEQLNSLDRSLIKKLKEVSNGNKNFKLWSLLSTNLSLTKLSSESRMGKGKGSVYTHALFVKPGFILFEFSGLSRHQVLDIIDFIKNKISLKIILVLQDS
nr:ribosomal protein L16 [Ahnfeltia plicata]